MSHPQFSISRSESVRNKVRSGLFSKQGILTLAAFLQVSLRMLEGQLMRELKLGGINHNRMRKWVKPVYCQKVHVTGRPSRHKAGEVPLKAHF
jgi:hypothetical protein